MRELTHYEQKKWIDFGGLSDEPIFLTNGDELEEAFHALLEAESKSTYLDDEIVTALQVAILDMYYYQIHLYTGEYGGYDEPNDLGLPSDELFLEKARELGLEDMDDVSNAAHQGRDEARQLWDWAVEYYFEHQEATLLNAMIARQKMELARLESMKALEEMKADG